MALMSVVKYNGSPDVFAWKWPDGELPLCSRLIVSESQKAILFQGGEVAEVYEAGSYTIVTPNIPVVETLVNAPFGGFSPFSAEVWFVSKLFNFDVKWGTPSPIQLQDPKYGIFVSVRANGQFGIQISDPVCFLLQLVGTLSSFSKRDISQYFRGVYVTRVKDAISSFILQERISLLEINQHLDELSGFLHDRIAPVMDEYGIDLVSFNVNDISIPEDDISVVKLKETLAKRAEMDIIGFDYVQERSFNTLEGAATNPNSGASAVMGAGVGMGMGLGMGEAFAGIARNLYEAAGVSTGGTSQGVQIAQRAAETAVSSGARVCSHCGAEVAEGHRFCGVCGCDQSLSEPEACSTCKKPVPQGFHFCPYCGTDMNLAMGKGSDCNGAGGNVDGFGPLEGSR
ncbi:antifreeze protein type I [Eggerthellaceae bacterium zg-887]|uniref:SPFH domain-containing protein n=1 Tax=Xiamenia xianingshaonis TaxID=2682776 RepID=UPI00140C35D3|nr:SPFH domain-containing protein [Xiamenia xianingshaonis]NHM16452.1 antifreeze protein type I [Xiamenia xianingshaonis]